MRLVEETVPHPHITIANSERPGSLAEPFDQAREREIREIMEQAYGSLVATGYGSEEAINRLRTVWPFELFPSLLESIREAKLMTNSHDYYANARNLAIDILRKEKLKTPEKILETAEKAAQAQALFDPAANISAQTNSLLNYVICFR